MYYGGEGVAQDFVKAVNWLIMAAEQGNTDAQYNLGQMYYRGEGVPQNSVEAYAWLNLATAQGHDAASEARDLVLEGLTQDQVVEGQGRSWEHHTRINGSGNQ